MTLLEWQEAERAALRERIKAQPKKLNDTQQRLVNAKLDMIRDGFGYPDKQSVVDANCNCSRRWIITGDKPNESGHYYDCGEQSSTEQAEAGGLTTTDREEN